MEPKVFFIDQQSDYEWEQLGVKARNRDSRMFEEKSDLWKTKIVLFDPNDPSFDENSVANALGDAIEEEIWDGEDFTFYTADLKLVGFAYRTE